MTVSLVMGIRLTLVMAMVCSGFWLHPEIQVKDNGIGFNAEKEMNYPSASLAGNGLKNMQARAAELKGVLNITSGETGTIVELTCPTT